MKLLNLMLGLKSPGGSSTPCFLCHVVRKFGKFETKNGVKRRVWPSNRASFLEKGQPRSLTDWKLSIPKRLKIGIKEDIIPSLYTLLDTDATLAQVVV